MLYKYDDDNVNNYQFNHHKLDSNQKHWSEGTSCNSTLRTGWCQFFKWYDIPKISLYIYNSLLVEPVLKQKSQVFRQKTFPFTMVIRYHANRWNSLSLQIGAVCTIGHFNSNLDFSKWYCCMQTCCIYQNLPKKFELIILFNSDTLTLKRYTEDSTTLWTIKKGGSTFVTITLENLNRFL